MGWAWAFGTPFKWTKQVASHFGGTRQGMAVSWPKRIKNAGGIRTQFHHVIDIVPTILEAARIEMPSTVDGIPQKPMDGVGMAHTWDKAIADAPSRRKTQYFEMLAMRGIYHDGWMASTTPPFVPWAALEGLPQKAPKDIGNDYTWELYNLADDPTQAEDIAAKHPQKLAEIQKDLHGRGGEAQRAAAGQSVAVALHPAQAQRDARPDRGRGKPDAGHRRVHEGRAHGGDLRSAPAGKSPTFLVAALKDPIGANLDRIQIVKGWMDAQGALHEQVHDVAWSGTRKPDPSTGKLPPVGSTLDVANATWTNTIGAGRSDRRLRRDGRAAFRGVGAAPAAAADGRGAGRPDRGPPSPGARGAPPRARPGRHDHPPPPAAEARVRVGGYRRPDRAERASARGVPGAARRDLSPGAAVHPRPRLPEPHAPRGGAGP